MINSSKFQVVVVRNIRNVVGDWEAQHEVVYTRSVVGETVRSTRGHRVQWVFGEQVLPRMSRVPLFQKRVLLLENVRVG